MRTLNRLTQFANQYPSQAQFARACGCSRQFISLVLQGERGVSWPLAKRISEVTGIPPADLMEIGPDRDRVA